MTACISQSLRYFATKLHNFTKFMMFFSTMKFLNSKARLKGERSITAQAIRLAGAIRLNFSTFLQESNQPICHTLA
jgi:hypothetical protein